jgi:hypothetical protein
MPRLVEKLAARTVSGASAGDRDAVVSLARAFSRAASSGEAAPPVGTRSLENKCVQQAFEYEVFKKRAFIPNPVLDDAEHSAILVRNLLFAEQPGGSTGTWFTLAVIVQSGNKGASADSPEMTRKCTSRRYYGKWWWGYAEPCPGTHYPVAYGIAGVCNDSSRAEILQLMGQSPLEAKLSACIGFSTTAPDCGEGDTADAPVNAIAPLPCPVKPDLTEGDCECPPGAASCTGRCVPDLPPGVER